MHATTTTTTAIAPSHSPLILVASQMTTSNLFGSVFILLFIIVLHGQYLFCLILLVLLNIFLLKCAHTLSHTHTLDYKLENSKTMTCLFEILDNTLSSAFECPFCNCHPFLVKQADSSTTTTIITPFLLFLFSSHISHRFVYATIIIVLVYGSNACVCERERERGT